MKIPPKKRKKKKNDPMKQHIKTPYVGVPRLLLGVTSPLSLLGRRRTQGKTVREFEKCRQ